MYGLLLVLFVVICFFLVVVVLMQSGRGGGLSGAFGGGGNQTVFGGRGAVDFLGKATWVLGGAYMAFALILAILSATAGDRGTKGLIEKTTGSFPTTPLTSPLPSAAENPSDAIPGDAPATAPGAGVPAANPESGSGTTEEPGSSGR